MSDEAFSWLRTIQAPDPLSRAVLKELCGYADPLGVTWSPVPVLAFDLMKSERMIQRALRALEKAGLMKANGKFHHRNVPFYQLNLDQPGERAIERAAIIAGVRAEAAGRRRRVGANGDMGVTVEKPNGDAGVTLNGDMGDTQQQRTTPSSEGSNDPPKEGAGVREIDVCEVAFEAYPVEGRRGPSSLKLWRSAWASEVAGGASGLVLLGAVRAYAGDRRAWGSSGRPKAAHAWLEGGCWDGFVVEAAVSPTSVLGPVRWTGPAEIREQLLGVKSSLVASCLDWASWDGAAVVPRTTWARDQLREAFRGTKIKVLDPAKVGEAVG